MGGRGSGRRGDQARRREAEALRVQGLSLAEIARRLGITRQGAGWLLRRSGKCLPAVHCVSCAAVVADRANSPVTAATSHSPRATSSRTARNGRNVADLSCDGTQFIATDQMNDQDPGPGTAPGKPAVVTIDSIQPHQAPHTGLVSAFTGRASS
jgi:DNA-binding CsgD family transcriptional regulator